MALYIGQKYGPENTLMNYLLLSVLIYWKYDQWRILVQELLTRLLGYLVNGLSILICRMRFLAILLRPIYEERRAVDVLQKSKGFKAVINLHTFGQFGDNIGLIDLKRGGSPIVLGFLGGLELRGLVITTYGVSRAMHITLVT
jgi:hypothetical protein